MNYSCVPDERNKIRDELIHFSTFWDVRLVVTTGGTGPAHRDVTPEATEDVIEKLLPGFGEQMRAISLLSYQLQSYQGNSGVRGQSLMFNLPGRPKAIRETIDEIWRAVPLC